MLRGRKLHVITAMIVLSVVMISNAAHAARKNVVISEQNWTGSTVVCHLMKYVLEEKLDIPVKIIPLNGAATWAGIEKGDVDVFSDIWETSELEGIKKYVLEKKVAEISLSYPSAPHGWYIPKYIAEEHGVKAIEDLKGKEALFDLSGDGKGDLWVGPGSWKVAEQNKIRIRDYGLDFTPVEVEQWAWLAQLKDAYKKKKPVVFYYWEPEWIFSQYELVQIKEAPYTPEKWTYVEKDPENSKITCGLPYSNVWVGYASKLQDRLPRAYRFFRNYGIPVSEVNKLIFMVTDLPDNPKLSNEEAAKKWVEENPEIVARWIANVD